MGRFSVVEFALPSVTPYVTLLHVILGFSCKATQDLFNGVDSKRSRQLGNKHVRQAAIDMLDLMNIAATLDDLRSPPSNHLEKLKGTLSDSHSVRLNRQFRIIFKWTPSGPGEVRFDNHSY